jgi:hypothetical protein
VHERIDVVVVDLPLARAVHGGEPELDGRFGAMTGDRAYRKAMPYEAAIAELRRCAGTQFDPSVVEAMVDVTAERAASALALVA